MKKSILIAMVALFTYNAAKAGNVPPVPVLTSTPNQTWFYNLEDVVFSSTSSYDTDGYVNYSRFYINGVLKKSVTNTGSYSTCFALYGSPAGDCYVLANGVTTVSVKLEVRDNSGEWSSTTTVYTIQQHKGRKYFLTDHLGNVRTTVNRDGNVLGYDDYYAFGLSMPGSHSSNTSNPNDNYKFTGHERDDEAGLTIDYMNARTYDPVLGRFMQVDPVLEYASSYAYVGNNPLNLVDPTGMFSCNTNSDEDCASQYATYSENKHNALEAGFGGAFDLNTGINKLAQNQTTQSGGNCPDGEPCPDEGETSNGVGLTANAFTVSGVFFLYLDDVISLQKYKQGYRRGLVENYKLIGRNFSLFKDTPMNAHTRPSTGFGQPGRIFSGTGTVLGIVSVGYDIRRHNLGEISTGRFAYNTTFTGLSFGTAVLASGPWGIAVGGVGIALDLGYQIFQDVRTSWSIQLGNYESQMRKGILPGGLSY